MHYKPKAACSVLLQVLLICLPLLLTTCKVGPVINSSYDRSASFATYQTYTWHPAELPTSITNSGLSYSTLLDQQVKAAIESELVKVGLRPTDSNPDLLIAYDVALPANQATETDTAFAEGFGYGYSYWYGYRYRYNVTTVPGFVSIKQLPVGTLVIDLVNAATNQLVWRGWHEAEINPGNLGEYEVSKAVARIMSRYPPVPVNTP